MPERRRYIRRIIGSHNAGVSLPRVLEMSPPKPEGGIAESSDQKPDPKLVIESGGGTDHSKHKVLITPPSLSGKSGKAIESMRVAGGSDEPVRSGILRADRVDTGFMEERVTVPITAQDEAFGWRAEQMFWEFYNRSEDPEGYNRRWNIERDIPWKQIEHEPLSKDAATMIEAFFAVESYLPDFAEKGLGYYRSLVGMSSAHINWSYEELKHGRTLQLVLERSGARTPDHMREFRQTLARNVWTMPYPTAREMLIYAAFQEKETHRNYELLRGVVVDQGAEGAGQGLRTISRDEAFHHAFYKDLVRVLLEFDEVGTAQDIQRVAASFKMPAQHLIPDMGSRVRTMVRNGVVSSRQIRDEAIIPTIKAFGFRDPDELASVASAKTSLGVDNKIITIDPNYADPEEN